MKPVSLQKRLIFSVLGVTCFVYLFSALALYETLEISAESTLRQALHRQFELVKGLLEEEDNGRIIELELDQLKTGEFVELYSGRYYVVLVPGQSPILSASLGGAMPTFMQELPQNQRELKEQRLTGPLKEELMVLSQTIHFAQREILVVAAESLTETKSWLNSIHLALLIGIPVTLIVLLGLVWWVARLALKPLLALIHDIHAFDFQSAAHLPPAKKPPATEISKLAAAFNGLLERIQKVRQTEEQLLIEVSHQLKTPVTIILSTCDVLLQRERPPAKYQEALTQIRQTGRHMRTLLVRLLSAAQLDATEHREHTVTALDLNLLITTIVDMMQPFAEKKQIALNFHPEDIPMIQGNAARLSELLTLLIENALHYSAAHTHVDLSSTQQAGKVVLSVADQGMGIPAADLPHIFTRFFRGSNTDGIEGSGLGLTLAQQIVTQHHGEISSQSVIGQGSRFTIIFPAL